MELELVTVGTELLLGFTLDTNAAEIGAIMASEGVKVARTTTVPDQKVDIQSAVAAGLDRTGFVIVTGGLGPTQDDITKEAVAEVYGVPLDLDGAYLEKLKVRFAKAGWDSMPESNKSQAEVPRGAVTLANPRGTAPGLWLGGKQGTTVMLPGIPEEMRAILNRQVVPRLRAERGTGESTEGVTRSLVLRTTGVSESRLADTIRPLHDKLEGLTLAFLPGVDGTDLRLTAWQMAPGHAAERLSEAADVLRPAIGENLYGHDAVELAEVLIERLRVARYRLSVAESCTGGLIGARITAIPGSSDVFVGGVICYSNESKVRDLGVDEAMIKADGAVSEGVAAAMVGGACERFGTDAGVAVTGIAGPGGATGEKRVGTACIAARAGDRTAVTTRWFPGARDEVRQRTAQAALDLLRRLMG